MAIAASLRPLWWIPASPSQLPGFAHTHGFNAHAPLVMIAMCIAGAFVGALLAAPRGGGRPRPPEAGEAPASTTKSIVYALLLIVLAHFLMSADAPVINLFEHGFDLTPAGEMLHGARLYRDVIPMHGPLGDGAIDATAMRLFGAIAGSALNVRYAFALINVIALFLLGLAMSGNAEIALLGVLLTFTFLPANLFALGELAPALLYRSWAAFLALSLAALGVRKKSEPLLIAAALMTAIAGLVSADFGLYTFVALVTALVLTRTFVKPLIAFAVVVIIFLATIDVASFARTVFHEMPRYIEAYALGFPRAGVLEIAGAIVVVGTFTLGRRGAGAPLSPFLVAGAWVIASTIALGERQHAWYAPLLAPIFVSAAYAMFRLRAFVLAILLAPLVLYAIPEALHRKENVARVYVKAEGVYFVRDDLPNLAHFNALLTTNLKPGETFYEFTNLASLHFLFRRRLPIRQLEVPMIETDDVQREVIERLSRDRGVTMVVEHFPYWSDSIDGIPNGERAPRLYAWIVREFPTRIEENGIVIRLRRR